MGNVEIYNWPPLNVSVAVLLVNTYQTHMTTLILQINLR